MPSLPTTPLGRARAWATVLVLMATAPEAAWWLKLPDKRDAAGMVLPEGSRSWEDAPVRGDLLDSLVGRGWRIRTTLKWANLVSAESPVDASSQPGSDLPAGIVLESPVARSPRPVEPPAGAGPVFRGQALRGGAARATSVDPSRVTLLRMHEAMGISEVRDTLVARGAQPGKGVRVAVIDDGFVLQHHVLEDASVVDAHDWVDDDGIPWDSGPAPWEWSHGTATAGLIASRWDVTLPGVAPFVDLLLYRTEDDAREDLVEEDHLAAALERAVERGAGVASISLGYRFAFDGGVPDHPYSAFDGRQLVASRTASWAAGRNVVVVAAIGNEGGFGPGSLGSPADADSILAVGAIAENGLLCPFSSLGPSADGRIKPDLVAFGCGMPVATGDSAGGYTDGGGGTSFATPLVAGAAALLRQLYPGWSALQVRDSLRASGANASRPDNKLGWGLPDLRRFLVGTTRTEPGPFRLPGVWNPGREALRFLAGAPEKPLEFEFRRLDGRLVHRATIEAGAPLWTGSPSPGGYIAVWKVVDGTHGSAKVIVSGR
ncbi:MAG: S8 family serine peptidase [Fibrobacteria bacterium]|nr:S8 family serine peptidase [Fibrobacteria bacterium]